jgi:hypothetical protein
MSELMCNKSVDQNLLLTVISEILRHSGVINIGFEVFTAVVTKSSTFWDITPCNLLQVQKCFWGTRHLLF